jgi:hypothetical protein
VWKKVRFRRINNLYYETGKSQVPLTVARTAKLPKYLQVSQIPTLPPCANFRFADHPGVEWRPEFPRD